jgi:hypothetical protein
MASVNGFPYSQAVVDIIATGKFLAVYACRLSFKDETILAHTGLGPIVINGETYQGVGDFGSVGTASETNNGQSALSIDLELNGLSLDILSQTNVKGCRGRPAKLMFAVMSKDGTQMATDILFSGRMDAAQISYGGNKDENKITVTIVDRMAEWQRTGTERWTDENHRARHGDDDRFFYAISQLASWPIYWGAQKDAPAFKSE